MLDYSIDDLVLYKAKSHNQPEQIYLDGEVCKITNILHGQLCSEEGDLAAMSVYEITAQGISIFADPDELEIVFTI